MNFDLNNYIKDLRVNYLWFFPEDNSKFDILNKQILDNEKIGSRKNFNWHITWSARILSPDSKKIVIIHNINLDKWLAPWWHWEQWDNEVYNTSKREAVEETWLTNIELLPWHKENHYIPIAFDTHAIPENKKKNENTHYHHDFRYIFILKEFQDIDLQQEEVKWCKWLSIDKKMEEVWCNLVLERIRNII